MNISNWDGAEKRRSYRLSLQIPIHVDYFPNDPGRLVSDTVTIKVNTHGALFRVPWGVPRGQELLVQNSSSLETQHATVVFVEYAGDGNFDVGVDFIRPNPTFWGVTFPPDDWTPAHPDAKQSV